MFVVANTITQERNSQNCCDSGKTKKKINIFATASQIKKIHNFYVVKV